VDEVRVEGRSKCRGARVQSEAIVDPRIIDQRIDTAPTPLDLHDRGLTLFIVGKI
jgi:hypothetical protein